jgi:hypothetical protein
VEDDYQAELMFYGNNVVALIDMTEYSEASCDRLIESEATRPPRLRDIAWSLAG